MALATVISENTEKEFGEFLLSQIRSYNNDTSAHHRAARKPGAITPLSLILKDEAANEIVGLAASTYWGWLEIDDFYLPQELRGNGMGTTLLQTAERIAIQRGCRGSFLTTFDFQARTFYEKQGYYVVGKLEDYPPCSAYYWMRKDLAPEQP
jgi:GNAT superfamily N-acetyltransferase